MTDPNVTLKALEIIEGFVFQLKNENRELKASMDALRFKNRLLKETLRDFGRLEIYSDGSNAVEVSEKIREDLRELGLYK